MSLIRRQCRFELIFQREWWVLERGNVLNVCKILFNNPVWCPCSSVTPTSPNKNHVLATHCTCLSSTNVRKMRHEHTRKLENIMFSQANFCKNAVRSLIFRWCAYVRGTIPACDRTKTIWRDTLNVLLAFHQYHGVCAQISMFYTQKHLPHSIPTSPTHLWHQTQRPCWIRAQKKECGCVCCRVACAKCGRCLELMLSMNR